MSVPWSDGGGGGGEGENTSVKKKNEEAVRRRRGGGAGERMECKTGTAEGKEVSVEGKTTKCKGRKGG